MGRSQKPRKKYRPKQAVLPMTIRHSNSADLMLKMVPHEELEAMAKGEGTEVSINTLAFRLNWGYALAVEVFDSEDATKITLAGLDAIRGVIDRHKRTGKIGVSGAELTAMGDALKFADEMQSRATRREQLAAIDSVMLVGKR